MTVTEQIELLKKNLKLVGLKGSEYQVAKMLGVQPSTVLRWRRSETEPRQKQMRNLMLLERVIDGVRRGRKGADKILSVFAVHPELVSQGLSGIVIASGLSWLLVEPDEEQPK